jgi:hypothetical protein
VKKLNFPEGYKRKISTLPGGDLEATAEFASFLRLDDLQFRMLQPVRF